MKLSRIARSVGESATLALNARAAALRAENEPVIHLGGGEPKDKAPAAAVARAAEVLDTGEVRYAPTAGVPELRKAIVEYTQRIYGRKVEAENVMAAAGAKHALMCCLQAVLDPGDEVLFPAPYWVSYPEMVKLCGAVPVPVVAADGGLLPTLQDLSRRITDSTKAVVVNSPSNPSGLIFPEEFVRGAVEFCEEKGIYIIMDNIYYRLVFDGVVPPNPYDYAKQLGEGSTLVLVDGVSKQYAMTGFRLGWSIAEAELTKTMTNIQAHETSSSCTVSQWAAVGALSGSQDCVEELRSSLQRKRDVMMNELASVPGVRVERPQGTFYCFADFRDHERDSTKMSEFLLDKALVVTVPGVEFGMEGFLRLSFCGPEEEIVEGVRRIRWALDPDAPREIESRGRKFVRDWK